MNDEEIVSIRGLVKEFEEGRLRALDGVDLDVRKGEFVAIVGPSGCGKSTLLHLIAALDRPTAGSIVVAGHDLATARISLNHYRATDVGIVFQLDNLLPTLTASENVQVPAFGKGIGGSERRKRAEELLALVGLGDRANARPRSFRAASASASRSLAPSPTARPSSSPTSPPDALIRLPAGESST